MCYNPSVFASLRVPLGTLVTGRFTRIWVFLFCYWSGLDEAPSDTREDHRSALRDINGDSPFTQPPLKVVEI